MFCVAPKIDVDAVFPPKVNPVDVVAVDVGAPPKIDPVAGAALPKMEPAAGAEMRIDGVMESLFERTSATYALFLILFLWDLFFLLVSFFLRCVLEVCPSVIDN